MAAAAAAAAAEVVVAAAIVAVEENGDGSGTGGSTPSQILERGGKHEYRDTACFRQILGVRVIADLGSEFTRNAGYIG